MHGLCLGGCRTKWVPSCHLTGARERHGVKGGAVTGPSTRVLPGVRNRLHADPVRTTARSRSSSSGRRGAGDGAAHHVGENFSYRSLHRLGGLASQLAGPAHGASGGPSREQLSCRFGKSSHPHPGPPPLISLGRCWAGLRDRLKSIGLAAFRASETSRQFPASKAAERSKSHLWPGTPWS